MNEFVSDLLGSATAGLLGRFICHPFDTIKSRLQSGNPIYLTFSQTALITLKRDGLRGFYKGLGAVMVGGIPGVSIYLTSYERSKAILTRNQDSSNFMAYFISGIIAEAVSCIIFVPVDVVKERLQVQSIFVPRPTSPSNSSSSASARRYNGSIDALNKIMREEGLRGIYKGYGATLLSYGPFSALYFMFYEILKDFRMTSLGNKKNDIAFVDSLVCAASAGSAAAILTSPLDLAKLRMQIASDASVNFLPTLLQIYRTEGVTGLFRGAGARVLFHTPSTAITMAAFEQCKVVWMNILA